jgi:hypothetical protein
MRKIRGLQMKQRIEHIAAGEKRHQLGMNLLPSAPK